MRTRIKRKEAMSIMFEFPGSGYAMLKRHVRVADPTKLTECPACKKKFLVDSARKCSGGCKDAVRCPYCDSHIFVHREAK